MLEDHSGSDFIAYPVATALVLVANDGAGAGGVGLYEATFKAQVEAGRLARTGGVWRIAEQARQKGNVRVAGGVVLAWRYGLFGWALQCLQVLLELPGKAGAHD